MNDRLNCHQGYHPVTSRKQSTDLGGARRAEGGQP